MAHWMSESLSYEDYLARYGSLTYTNVGTSMLPLLREGRDLFIVVPKDGRCTTGDVVLFRRPPDKWVLHRVVEVLEDGYLTLGDNCVAREFVAEDNVIGVMSGFVRIGRDGRERKHGVDELGYRVYRWGMVALERPRVFLKRILLSVRRWASKVVRHAQ